MGSDIGTGDLIEITKNSLQESLEVGIATIVGANTITDLTKNWTVNVWAGSLVQITSGVGIGQVRTIASNVANTITTTTPWTTAPAALDTYRIFGGAMLKAVLDAIAASLVHIDLTQFVDLLERLGVPDGVSMKPYPEDGGPAGMGISEVLKGILYSTLGIETGTCSDASTVNVLVTDAATYAKDWPVNIFKGYLVHLIYGPGRGDFRVIASNTADTLTPDAPFSAEPTVNTQFRIIPFTGSQLIAVEIEAGAGNELSDAIDLGTNNTITAILMDAAWTAASLTFQAAEAMAGTFGNVIDENNVEVTVQAQAGVRIPCPSVGWALKGLRYLKVRSGTSGTAVAQAALRTLYLVVV